MHMLHHLSIGVADLARSIAFYDAILTPLGYVRVWADSTAAGYGPPGGGDKLALKHRPRGNIVPGDGHHIAFSAPDRDSVASFHRAALAQGGTDLGGGPRLHPEYGPDYFAAYVLDPDGHRLEAVIIGPS